MTDLTINIITIAAEVVLVFIFFYLVNWCFNKLYRQIFKIPLLEKFKDNVSVIRRNISGFLLLSSFILSLGIIGINGYLVYRGENVRDYSLQIIRKIPTEFWINLGLEIIKSIGIIIVTSLVLRIFDSLLDKVSRYAQDFDGITDNDKSIATFFTALKKNIDSVSWIAIAILCAQFLFLPLIITKYLYVLLRVYLIVALGLLVFKIVAVIIDSLDALSVKYSSPDNLLRFYDQLRHLIPFFKRCLEYIIYVLMATIAIKQIDFVANLASWGAIGIKLISIFLLSRILISIAYLVVEEFRLKSQDLTEAQQKRRQTISPLIQSIVKYFIYFGAGIFMLETISIDPGPILAGAGILGLAVGLGAQNLINDIVSGFFILFENYYLVGDYIETDEASGYVEAIELRTTRIRHQLGQVYIVRNGDITSITNFSKDFVYAYVEVGVDYGTNLALIQEIIEKVGRQLQEESDDILEPTQVDGIKEFGDIRLSIFTVTKVKPGRHIQAKRILRQMLKEAFDREGIYIPLGETADKPDWVSKVQLEQSRKYRNRKAKVKKVLHEPKSILKLPQTKDRQVSHNQQQEKLISDKFIEETAKIIENASQQTIVPQPEENLTIYESTSENQILQQASQQTIIPQPEASLIIYESASENQILQQASQQTIIPQPEARSTIEELAKEAEIQQDEERKNKQKDTSKQSKTLKKMLQEFLDTH